jgi:exodeoxyribonuclease V alpha subunit
MTPREDRRFFGCRQGQIVEAVSQVCESALRKGFTARDIQVLAPIYKGNAGIDALNDSLQELFNPAAETKKEMSFGQKKFRVGDKVLQLANNPDEQVFNGDIGKIIAMFRAKETTEKEDLLIVDFDGIEVTYLKRDLHQLTLAYCCSIHKSQGSEFPIVVLPIVKGYHRMLRRNLIYTAVTRTTSYLIVCGDQGAFEQAVHKSDLDDRYSSLTEKLIERLTETVADEKEEGEEMPFSPEEEVEIPFPDPEPIKE